MLKFIVPTIFILSGAAAALYAEADTASAFPGVKCEVPNEAKFNWSKYIDAFAFDEALPLCDVQNRCPVSVRNWLGIREFSRGNYAAAEKWFADSEQFASAVGKAPTWNKKKGWGALEDIRRYLKQRRELGNITPEYVQRIRVLYPRYTRATAPFTKKQLVYDATPCRLKHVELNFGVLKQYVELFSRGKVSIAVDYQVVDGTVTRFNKGGSGIIESIDPWSEQLANVLNDTGKNYDLLWFLYPYKGGVAYGGIGRLPLSQDGKQQVGMRRVWFPDGWGKFSNFPQFFHEYLHTVEFSNGVKITTHGAKETARILRETGLSKGLGETDYAEWHFAHTIPGSKTLEQRFGYPNRKTSPELKAENVAEQLPEHADTGSGKDEE